MDGNKTIFAEGFYATPKSAKAPEWIVAKFGINVNQLDWFRNAVEDAKSQGKEFINFDIREGKNGKHYIAVDTFEPKKGGSKSSAPF